MKVSDTRRLPNVASFFDGPTSYETSESYISEISIETAIQALARIVLVEDTGGDGKHVRVVQVPLVRVAIDWVESVVRIVWPMVRVVRMKDRVDCLCVREVVEGGRHPHVGHSGLVQVSVVTTKEVVISKCRILQATVIFLPFVGSVRQLLRSRGRRRQRQV